MTDEHATNELVDILLGASFDSMRIYSVVLQIAFMKTNPDDGALDQVWLSINGGMQVGIHRVDDATADPAAARAQAVGLLSLLFGQTVSSVHVDDRGELSITVGDQSIRAYSAGYDMEDIWTVYSGSSAPYDFHERYVGLADTGEVVIRREPRRSRP